MTTHSHERRAVHGAIWTTMGFGSSQFIRLASNIILWHLLFEEAFGVMLYVNTLIQFLGMFTDVGLSASIVQNPRGEDPKFLRTAWTLQVLRGFALWMVAAVVLAWPAAHLYDVPGLMWYLPVASASAFVNSFLSAEWHHRGRKLDLRTITLIELGGQCYGALIMIVWAFFAPSPWALIGGTLSTGLWMVTASHFLLGGLPMRFTLDMDYAKEMFHFGKWIFPSTALTFLVTKVSPLIIGLFMTVGQVGIFSIANNFANMMVELIRVLTMKILFPLYARIHQSDPASLRRRTRQARLTMMAATLPPIWVLAIWGPNIVNFLYPDRATDAGWMLQILACGAAISAVLSPADTILLASGDSFRHMTLLAIRSVCLIASMLVGGFLGDAQGILIALAVSNAVYYPFLVPLIRRYGVWMPELDAGGLAASAGAIALGLWVTGQL